MKYRRHFRLGAGDVDRELDDEIEAHIAMRAEELVRQGETPARARAIAIERFGSVRDVHESAVMRQHRLRRLEIFDEIRADATLVWRQARRSPFGTLLTALTFALGIGLTTAVFAIVDHVLLRPLPYVHPERVMALEGMDSAGDHVPSVSSDNWRDLDADNRTLSASALYVPIDVTMQSGDVAEHIQSTEVSSKFFDVLGARMLHGRGFVADDAKRGSGSIIVRASFLATRMGGDMSQQVMLDGHPHHVVGVIPDEAAYPEQSQVWIPFEPAFYGDGARNNINYSALGRLRAGTSAAQAATDLTLVARGIEHRVPTSVYTHGTALVPLQEFITGDTKLYLVLMLGAVLCVLLIACANLAGINFARAAHRSSEIAVRMALGAGRARVIRQLVTEQLVLATAGGALGVFVAAQATSWASAYAATTLPRAAEITLDARVILFAVMITLLAGILAALAPTWRAANTAPRELIGARGVAHGGRSLPGSMIVVAEVAAAVVLLTGGMLLVRSFQAMLGRDLGFQPDGVVTASVTLSRARYPDDASIQAFWQNAMPRLAAVPGARIVGRGNWIPASFAGRGFVDVEGQTTANPGAVYHAVSPDYFRAMGMRITNGRAFAARPESPRPVVINQQMANTLWPGASPIGRRIRTKSMEGFTAAPAAWLTVIGVVGDVRQNGYEVDPTEEMYVDDDDVPYYERFTHVVARTTPGAEAALVKTLTHELNAIDPSLAPSVTTMNAALSSLTVTRRVIMILISVFAGVALTLAGIGIYALLSFAVTQRTREIGVRGALGASRTRIIRSVVSNALRVAAVGALIGSLAAYWLCKLIESLLIDVTRADIASYILAAVILGCVTFFAAAIPAWRAARVDPLTALQSN